MAEHQVVDRDALHRFLDDPEPQFEVRTMPGGKRDRMLIRLAFQLANPIEVVPGVREQEADMVESAFRRFQEFWVHRSR